MNERRADEYETVNININNEQNETKARQPKTEITEYSVQQIFLNCTLPHVARS